MRRTAGDPDRDAALEADADQTVVATADLDPVATIVDAAVSDREGAADLGARRGAPEAEGQRRAVEGQIGRGRSGPGSDSRRR